MGINLVKSTMAANPNTISVYKGASKDVGLNLVSSILDPDGNPEQEPFDLTGCTLYFIVRNSPENPKFIIYKVSTDTTQILIATDPRTGIATIFIQFVDTELLLPGLYFYEVWVLEPSGKRYPVVETSEFVVMPAVMHFDD